MRSRPRRVLNAVSRTVRAPRFVTRTAILTLVVTLLIANFIAAGVTLVLVVFVVPGESDAVLRDAIAGNAWFLLAYLALVIPPILWWSWRATRSVTHWIGDDAPPDRDEAASAPGSILNDSASMGKGFPCNASRTTKPNECALPAPNITCGNGIVSARSSDGAESLASMGTR